MLGGLPYACGLFFGSTVPSATQSINIATNIAAAMVPKATVTVTPALSELELLTDPPVALPPLPEAAAEPFWAAAVASATLMPYEVATNGVPDPEVGVLV